jgi:formate C-acetyltransferase
MLHLYIWLMAKRCGKGLGGCNMFELRPITPRVERLRKVYRDTIPRLDAERTQILTEYYKVSQNEVPIIRRARALQEILDHMTVRVEPGELLVSNQATTFRGVPLWPEYGGISWLIEELDSGTFDKKQIKDGFMYLSKEDRAYLHSVEAFWNENCIAAKIAAALPEEINTYGAMGVSHDLPPPVLFAAVSMIQWDPMPMLFIYTARSL